MNRPTIKRALISVYDKTGVVEFARALASEFGVEIISTGGTASLLKKEGIPVTLVEEVTGFPELMDGRVKTLHPKIHAGILADRDNPEHMRQLAEHGIKPIDMVVVNLYPFEKTVADPNCTFAQAIEMIDIGGPCMLRAAAKNHKHVIPVCELHRYEPVLAGLREKGDLELLMRTELASMAYEATSVYDMTVEMYLMRRYTEMRIASMDLSSNETDVALPESVVQLWDKKFDCRYGENPHQKGAVYAEDKASAKFSMDMEPEGVASFNNYLDASAAFELCRDITCAANDASTDSKATKPCGTDLQSVTSSATVSQPMDQSREVSLLKPIETEHHSRRNLPHIQNPERCYFITFRVRQGQVLSTSEREIVFSACKYWVGKKIDLHAAVVMPDHVHMLLTPLEVAPEQWTSLGEVVHSIKRFSAREINKQRGAEGSLWLDEYFDRIMRNEKEFLETKDYIADNPMNRDLCKKPEEYAWWYDEDEHQWEGSAEAQDHRLQIGATLPKHRLQTGATQSVAVYIKHTNACGVGISDDPVEAYRRAYVADPNAAMGGILAVSFPVDANFAEAVMDSLARWGKSAGAGAFFVEVWLAPRFDDQAVEVIRTRKPWGANVRLLTLDMAEPDDPAARDFRRIPGGFLVQSKDTAALNEDQWKVVTKRQPTDTELADLRLAWLIAKHTKSNAISVVKDGMLIGNGAGQMSRVMSCRIATWLAKENGHADKLAGSVAASDAFFPFPDGPQILLDAGATALIQPGGSKRDEETVKLCDERGATMIFTGTRHFRH